MVTARKSEPIHNKSSWYFVSGFASASAPLVNVVGTLRQELLFSGMHELGKAESFFVSCGALTSYTTPVSVAEMV